MNRPKTIIGFALFYGVLFFILQGIGDSIQNDSYIRYVATGGGDTYNALNVSYEHLWNDALQDMGIDTWSKGEYEKSDRIKFEGVYHSTHSYSDQFTQSSGNTWLEKTANFFTGGWWDPGGLNWEHEHMKNISQGEQVYIYPYLKVNIPGGDVSFGGTNLKTYIFVRTFDAYSTSQQWLHEPDVKNVQFSGDRIEWIPRLSCGKMGKYDLYYVIDVAYFDQSLLNSIPGVNLLTDTELEDLIAEDKARFMERWGGVIYGDEHQDMPSTLSYHEMQYQNRGGISTFFEVIRNVQIGWTAFSGYGVISTGFNVLIGVFTLAFSLVIYYEIKSYLPFISGGEGES